MNKRAFIKAGIIGLSGLTGMKELESIFHSVEHLDGPSLAQNEDFWQRIRSDYILKQEYINLENGYYCFIPQPTLEKYIDHIRNVNREGSRYMRTVQWDNKDRSAEALAHIVNCDKDELIITRNTTESLDTIISGYSWEKDDEAVMAKQDYGAMLNQFNLMSKRYGIINRLISIPNHPRSDGEIVELYENAITQKTKLLMVCHMINITGHILPVKKICDMAHRHGVDVLVDGAHCIGHIQVDLKELGCDYYGTSLHKWMSVPLGAGFLYVKKDKVKNLWPMFAEWGKDENDIKKLNHTGTHPCATDLAILDAVDYYKLIGPQRKESRLGYLKNYWVSKVRDVEGITVNTPIESYKSCGIANVGIDRISPKEMADTLMKKYNIWTVAIDGAGVKGCRITPNVYTSTKELDIFVQALKELALA